MGRPLRQLLKRFFPDLYAWVSEESQSRGFAHSPGQPIDDHALPSPSELGLTKWINFYRSGDYVGRGLWIDGVFARTVGGNAEGQYPHPSVPTMFSDQKATRVEACIGFGAHTNYWDRTAPDIVTQLDKLIAR